MRPLRATIARAVMCTAAVYQFLIDGWTARDAGKAALVARIRHELTAIRSAGR